MRPYASHPPDRTPEALMNRIAESNGHVKAQAPPSANGHDGRGPRGRFGPGNKFGHGNPFNRQLAKIRTALVNALNAGEMKRLVRLLLTMGEQGNLDALRLLLSYTVGPPLRQSVDPDRCDLHELALLQEHPSPDDPIPQNLPPAVAVLLHRAAGALAAVARVADELGFAGSRPHVLDALRDANLDDLARAAQAYADSMTGGPS
jgi:hypothetical protein